MALGDSESAAVIGRQTLAEMIHGIIQARSASEDCGELPSLALLVGNSLRGIFPDVIQIWPSRAIWWKQCVTLSWFSKSQSMDGSQCIALWIALAIAARWVWNKML